jgi:hypothetical protein
LASALTFFLYFFFFFFFLYPYNFSFCRHFIFSCRSRLVISSNYLHFPLRSKTDPKWTVWTLSVQIQPSCCCVSVLTDDRFWTSLKRFPTETKIDVMINDLSSRGNRREKSPCVETTSSSRYWTSCDLHQLLITQFIYQITLTNVRLG